MATGYEATHEEVSIRGPLPYTGSMPGIDTAALAEALDVEYQKRNIHRTPDFPHGRSIKWPKVYRGLRRRGMDKEKAARISNAASNKYRGGRRMPLSATAGRKPIPEDILDKRPDLRKHYGPGPHDNGTDQSVHGSGGVPGLSMVDGNGRVTMVRREFRRISNLPPTLRKKEWAKHGVTSLFDVDVVDRLPQPAVPAVRPDDVDTDAMERAWLEDLNDEDLGLSDEDFYEWAEENAYRYQKHYGPGPHPGTMTEQSVHGRSGSVPHDDDMSLAVIDDKISQLNENPSAAPEVYAWARTEIDAARSFLSEIYQGGVSSADEKIIEQRMGSWVQRLNNLYYRARNVELANDMANDLDVAGSLTSGEIDLPTPSRRSSLGDREAMFAQPSFAKHYGPGPHANGSDQTVHGGGGGGGEKIDDTKQSRLASAYNHQFFRNVMVEHQYPDQLQEDDIIISGLSVPGPFQYRYTAKTDQEEGKAWLIGADEQGENVMRLVDLGRPLDLIRVPKLPPELLKKGQPDGGSEVHQDVPLGYKPKRKRRKGRDLLAPRFTKHMGPGPHPSGSPQTVHGAGAHGVDRGDIKEDIETEGGFTIDPATGERPTEGYMVSLADFEETYPLADLSVRDIGAYRARHWNQFSDIPNARWGGWVDGDTVYFDISIHTDSLDEAVKLGKRFDQKAIFHLDTFSEIRLDDDGTSLRDFKAKAA